MIEHIYVINLEKSINRRKNVEEQFKKYNIKNYTFFKAICPSENILKKYKNFSIKNEENVRRGELGCLLSHVNVMKDALNKNYKNIIIFEDDIIILDKDFIQKTINSINLLKKDFDVLFLGANHRKPAKRKVADGIYECTRSNCTFGYCINKDTMEKLIVDFDYILPWDVHWRDSIDPPIRFYCIIPHLVNTKDDESNIQHKKIAYSSVQHNSQKLLLQDIK